MATLCDASTAAAYSRSSVRHVAANPNPNPNLYATTDTSTTTTLQNGHLNTTPDSDKYSDGSCRTDSDDDDLSETGDNKDKYVHAPIDKLGRPGLWVRHMLLKAILLGTPLLMLLQKRRTATCNKLMRLFSFLGTEDFYTPLICLVTWVIDMKLGRLLALSMAAGFYTASLFKNWLCLPRPPTPPIIPLETAYDWSLPSHHSILGVMLPFYIFFYTYEHYHLSSPAIALLFTVIAFWSFFVMFSRLYLGVHSPADIICGSIIGCLLLIIILHVDDYVDLQCARDYMTLIQSAVYSLILLAVHPRVTPRTLSFADTVCVNGVALGVILARYTQGHMAPARRHTHLSLLEEVRLKPAVTASTTSPLHTLLLLALCRVVLGLLLVLVSKLLTSFLMRRMFRLLYRMCHVPSYSFSEYVKMKPMSNKHYKKGFCLPPLESSGATLRPSHSSGGGGGAGSETESVGVSAPAPPSALPHPRGSEVSEVGEGEGEDLSTTLHDIDIPTKLVTYTCMGFTGFMAPLVFYHIGLTVLS